MFRHIIAFLVEGEAAKYHNKLVNDVSDKFFLRKINSPSHIILKDSFYSDETEIFEEIIQKSIKKNQKNAKHKVYLEGINNLRDEIYFIDAKLSDSAKRIHEDIINELLQIKHVQWDEFDVVDRNFHLTITNNANKDNSMQVYDHLSQFSPNFELEFNNIAILRRIDEDGRWVVYKRFDF
jgi:hypothetical protein